MVVASANPDKIAEVEKIWEGLGVGSRIVRGLRWEDVEETGATLEEKRPAEGAGGGRRHGIGVPGG